MGKKIIVLAFTVFLVLSGAIALYTQCDQIGKHFDFGAEHQGRSIHCPDAYLNSNAVQSSPVRLHATSLFSKFLPKLNGDIYRFFLTAQFERNSNSSPFWHQDLYRSIEVYRL